jgi:hypothetical protein
VLESVDAAWGLPSPVGGLELCRREVADGLEESAVVEPVGPLQGGGLDLVGVGEHLVGRRSSSAPKNAAADFKISWGSS